MNKTTVVAVILGALFLLSSATTAWALYTRFEQTNHNRLANAEIWHVVICDLEGAVLKDKSIDAAQKVSFLKFYDRLLVDDVHAAPCGFAR